MIYSRLFLDDVSNFRILSMIYVKVKNTTVWLLQISVVLCIKIFTVSVHRLFLTLC